MKAVRFHGVGEPLRIEDVPTPEPGIGEVLVRVAACGICASDLHIFDGSLPNASRPPVTPGHETSGTVAGVGDGVTDWTEGDRVSVFPGRRCGVCARCRNGGEVERCALSPSMGIDFDGGWAEFVAVPAECLVRVPDNVPLDQAAIICDAVGTPYNAVVEVAHLRPGERAAVFGIGGLGTHGVMIARLAGASFVAAIDTNAGARKRAEALGADLVIDPSATDPSAAIRDATGGEGVDVALDFVGANDVLKAAVRSLDVDGRAIVVGVGGDRIQLGPSSLFAISRTQLRGAYGYRRSHLETLLRLVSTGRLDLSGSVSATLPLDDANEGVAILSEKRNDPVRVLLVSTDSSAG